MDAKKLAFIFAFSFFLVNSVYGATRYVDGNLSSNCTSGNYSITNRACNGSDGNAYATISGAISASTSGDTISIRGGTYQAGSSHGTLYTISKNLTIRGYGTEVPILWNTMGVNGSDDWEMFYVDSNATVTFNNLKIRGTRNPSVDEDFGHVGILAVSGCYVIVDNCEFYEFNHCGVKGSAKFLIKNSYFHDIGTDTHDHHIYSTSQFSQGNETIIEYNRFGPISGAGIHIYTGGSPYPSYHIVRYNIIYGTSYWGILLGGQNCKIYNNTIYGKTYGLMFFRSGCQNNEVKNNIFFGNSYDLAIDSAGGSDPPGANNVCLSNYLGSSVVCSGCAGAFDYIDNAPPNIRNTNNPFILNSPSAWVDFRLASSSGAINTGANLGAAHQNGIDPNHTTWPASTLDQNSNGSGWEIGAFIFRESGGETTPPSAPKNLGIDKN